MKPLFIIYLLLCVNKGAVAQDTIYWKPTTQLQWRDFQAKPDSASRYAASTSSGIMWSYVYKAGQFSFSVTSYFAKKRSWKRGNVTQPMLQHEQGHFDITELFARKLQEKVNKMSHLRSYFESNIAAVVVAILQEKDRMQRLYDTQTNYGTNYVAQEKWLAKITKELGMLAQP